MSVGGPNGAIPFIGSWPFLSGMLACVVSCPIAYVVAATQDDPRVYRWIGSELSDAFWAAVRSFLSWSLIGRPMPDNMLQDTEFLMDFATVELVKLTITPRASR